MCVNGKGITTVTLKSMDGVMIRCYIDLSLQKHICQAVMVSLSIAVYYQRVFLS
jgi:hypothetical protein